MSQNIELLKQFESRGIDPYIVIQESFKGYKSSKAKKEKINPDIPTTLIKLYYSLQPDEVIFDSIKKSFVKRYIESESDLECVHSKEEKAGLKKMYEFIHSDDVNFMFDIYTLKSIHEVLYSCSPHPEFGGNFRNYNVYLPNTGIGLCEWTNIRKELNKLDSEVLKLYEYAKILRETIDAEALLCYLDRCVVLKCNLIKIHPFADGNGRSVRGFINKLLEDAGLPPVYIKANERTEYHTAMNLANGEGDYTQIKAFYRYKICDSIVELDINNRTGKRIENSKNEKTLKKVIKDN